MRGVDLGIDVGTRGIGRDLGSCSAHHPARPGKASEAISEISKVSR